PRHERCGGRTPRARGGRGRPRLRRGRRPRRPDPRRRGTRGPCPTDRQRPSGRRRTMSTRPNEAGKLPLPELAQMKTRGDRIVMVTAYDAPAARLADAAGVEMILVGDTAAMVMLGHESTVPVTLDEMIFLTKAVTRAARRPLVVGDLPFGTYEVSDDQAVASAIRM